MGRGQPAGRRHGLGYKTLVVVGVHKPEVGPLGDDAIGAYRAGLAEAILFHALNAFWLPRRKTQSSTHWLILPDQFPRLVLLARLDRSRGLANGIMTTGGTTKHNKGKR